MSKFGAWPLVPGCSLMADRSEVIDGLIKFFSLKCYGQEDQLDFKQASIYNRHLLTISDNITIIYKMQWIV